MTRKFVSSLLVMSIATFGLGVKNAICAAQKHKATVSWLTCTNYASANFFGASAYVSPWYAYVPSPSTYHKSGNGTARASTSGGSTASSSVGTVSIGFTTAIIGGKLKIVRGSLTVVSQSASVTRGLFSRCSSSAQGYCGGASPAAASATWP